MLEEKGVQKKRSRANSSEHAAAAQITPGLFRDYRQRREVT